MKTLYLIGGTMGVGKTTVGQILKRRLPRAVFLDGDWCWDMEPFTVTEETKAMVTDNICHLLNNFLRCSELENVIFCWVMHEQAIPDGILARLEQPCRVEAVSLTCKDTELRRRLEKDIDAGLRTPDILARSAARLPLYPELSTRLIDTTELTPEQTAALIAK